MTFLFWVGFVLFEGARAKTIIQTMSEQGILTEGIMKFFLLFSIVFLFISNALFAFVTAIEH